MIRRWTSIYIRCHWTRWDPREIVRAALSTDSFFEVWEVIAPSANAGYVAMSMS